mgnify:FL=1
MVSDSQMLRAKEIVQQNSDTVLDAITIKYAKLFNAIEDYHFISIEGTEEEEQNLSTKINFLLQDLNITEEVATDLFEQYQSQVDDWKNACGEEK